MYDAIIIGARCAGSPTAMLLARKGYKVLLVDRATFPSDVPRNHVVLHDGTICLQKWGLLERIISSGTPPLRTMTVDLGDFPLKGELPPGHGVDANYGPRRTVLDKILLDAAAEAGAEVRQGFSVSEIVVEGDRVTGITGRSRGDTPATEHARIVIGADGQHSIVARSVNAPKYNEVPALTCGYYSYWSGVPCEGMEVYINPRPAFMIAFATNDDLTCVGFQVPIAEFPEYRRNIEAYSDKLLDLAPDLAERVRAGKREERFYGTADLDNWFRKPYGPGWALVGDAGYHKDPINARGMSDAFRDAGLLASAVDEGFSGRMPMDEALLAYEQQRNETALPQYEDTCSSAALHSIPPSAYGLRAAIRDDQALVDRFMGVQFGTVKGEEFFSSEAVQRILQAAR